MIKDLRKKPSLITIFLLSFLFIFSSKVYASDNLHIDSLDRQKYTNFELNVVDSNIKNTVSFSPYSSQDLKEEISYKLINKEIDVDNEENIDFEFKEVVRVWIIAFSVIGVFMILIMIIQYFKDR